MLFFKCREGVMECFFDVPHENAVYCELESEGCTLTSILWYGACKMSEMIFLIMAILLFFLEYPFGQKGELVNAIDVSLRTLI